MAIKKSEIRTYLTRLREDITRINAALRENDPRAIRLFGSDALGCLEEAVSLCEEKYDIQIECAAVGPCTEAAEAAEGEEEEEDEEDE